MADASSSFGRQIAAAVWLLLVIMVVVPRCVRNLLLGVGSLVNLLGAMGCNPTGKAWQLCAKPHQPALRHPIGAHSVSPAVVQRLTLYDFTSPVVESGAVVVTKIARKTPRDTAHSP